MAMPRGVLAYSLRHKNTHGQRDGHAACRLSDRGEAARLDGVRDHQIEARARDAAGRWGTSGSETRASENSVSELRAVPRLFNQLEETTTATGMLSEPEEWTARLVNDQGADTGLTRQGDGTSLEIYWEIDAGRR